MVDLMQNWPILTRCTPVQQVLSQIYLLRGTCARNGEKRVHVQTLLLHIHVPQDKYIHVQAPLSHIHVLRGISTSMYKKARTGRASLGGLSKIIR